MQEGILDYVAHSHHIHDAAAADSDFEKDSMLGGGGGDSPQLLAILRLADILKENGQNKRGGRNNRNLDES